VDTIHLNLFHTTEWIVIGDNFAFPFRNPIKMNSLLFFSIVRSALDLFDNGELTLHVAVSLPHLPVATRTYVQFVPEVLSHKILHAGLNIPILPCKQKRWCMLLDQAYMLPNFKPRLYRLCQIWHYERLCVIENSTADHPLHVVCGTCPSMH